jgi:hypothetical protein
VPEFAHVIAEVDVALQLDYTQTARERRVQKIADTSDDR